MNLEEHRRRLEKLGELKNEDRKVLRIAICGSFNSGKTSLLNALLGTNLPVKNVTTTGTLTKIHFGNKIQAEFADGFLRTISEKELKEFVTVKEKNLNGIRRSEAVTIWVGCRNELLKAGTIEFWDTPGLSDDKNLDEITSRAVEECDVVIFVMDATHLLSLSDKYFLAFKLAKSVGRNIIVAINKTDLLDQEELNEVIEEACERLSNFGNGNCGCGPVFTSANPKTLRITDLKNRLKRIVKDNIRRSTCIDTARRAKIKTFAEESLQFLEEDLRAIEDMLKLDLEQEQQKRFYLTEQSHLENFTKIHNYIDLQIRKLYDDSMWRQTLEQVQREENWEKNYVELSSKVMRETLEQIFSNMKTTAENFSSCYPSLKSLSPLNTETVWTHMNWGENFKDEHFGGMLSGAATGAAIGSAIPVIGTGVGAVAGLFVGAYRDNSENEKAKQSYQETCIDNTITAYLNAPAKVAENIAEAFRKNFLNAITKDFLDGIKSDLKIDAHFAKKHLALKELLEKIRSQQTEI